MDTTILVAIIGAVSASIIAPIITYTISKREKRDKKQDAMTDAVKLLLMDKCRYLTKCAVADGCISIEQLTVIHEMVNTAHDLGANGEMTICAQQIDKLPIKED